VKVRFITERTVHEIELALTSIPDRIRFLDVAFRRESAHDDVVVYRQEEATHG
jgi:hypothetical protein